MYVLMYAMVNVFDNMLSSLNAFYMAGLMTAPMIIIEIAPMKSMYPSAKWNVIILAASATLLVILWSAYASRLPLATNRRLSRK